MPTNQLYLTSHQSIQVYNFLLPSYLECYDAWINVARGTWAATLQSLKSMTDDALSFVHQRFLQRVFDSSH